MDGHLHLSNAAQGNNGRLTAARNLESLLTRSLRIRLYSAELVRRSRELLDSNAGHDVVTIAASAGGVAPLLTLLGGLPPRFGARVFVALHTGSHSSTALPSLLARSGPLPAAYARDGERIVSGRIYVAPANHHLEVHRGFVRLTSGSQLTSVSKSGDILFCSAASAYGRRVVGVVLSGALNDGTAGLQAIRAAGGVSIVQNPTEAKVPGMPQSAIDCGHVDYCLAVDDIAATLEVLSKRVRFTAVNGDVNPDIFRAAARDCLQMWRRSAL